MIGADAVLHDLGAGVVGAAFDGGAVRDALVDHRVRDHDGDHGRDGLAGLGEHRVEGLGLGDGAGEAVQQEAVHAFRALELRLDHAFDDFVGNEGACLDEGLGLEAERRARGDLAAEEFTRGEVAEVVLLHHGAGLGALAGARRAEENVVFHIQSFVSVSRM